MPEKVQSQKNRIMLAVGVLACVLLLLFCIVPLFNPLRRSPERIRASLLEDNPPGTCFEKAKSFIQSKGGIRQYHGRMAFHLQTWWSRLGNSTLKIA
jgi:hypothetical protein